MASDAPEPYLVMSVSCYMGAGTEILSSARSVRDLSHIQLFGVLRRDFSEKKNPRDGTPEKEMFLAEGSTVRVCGNRVQCTESTVGKARVAGEERERRAGCRGEGERWLGPGHPESRRPNQTIQVSLQKGQQEAGCVLSRGVNS